MDVDYKSLEGPAYSNSDIRKIANELRASSNQNGIPVDVELIAEKSLGLLLTPVPFLQVEVACEGYLTSTLDEITYAESTNKLRTRFTIAHEIGHFMMHKEFIKSMKAETIDKWKEMILDMPGQLLGRIEKEANRFAAELLIPMDLLVSEIIKLEKQLRYAEEVLHGQPNLEDINEFIAPELAKKFEVSSGSMKIFLNSNRINPYSLIS